MSRRTKRKPPRTSSRSAPAVTRSRQPGWRRYFHRIAKSHYTHLAAGVLLILTGILELVDGVLLDLEAKLEPHHALIVLGTVLVARSVADVLEGLESIERAEEDEDQRD